MVTANGLRQLLSDDQISELRVKHPYLPDLSQIASVVRSKGWRDGNVTFLNRERERGKAAMRDLMAALGVERVESRDEALELIAFAHEVFAPEGGFTGSIKKRPDGAILVTVRDCPVFQRMEDTGWLGVTACPSWHRRRGWFDALGVDGVDSVLADKKWGTPACVALLDVRG